MEDNFPSQIKALSGATKNKIKILDYLSYNIEGATSREIKSSVLKESKDATFYNYLNQLKSSNLISKKYEGGKYKYFLTGNDLSVFFKKELPKVRTSLGKKVEKWDSKYITNSLYETLLEMDKELRPSEIVEETEEIIKYSNLKTISKPTIRYLISEVLHNNDLKKECHAFLPVGFPLENIKTYSERESPLGLHKNFVGQKFREQYFIRQIPFNTYSYFIDHPDVHFHSIENLLYPLNVLHDIRWVFLGGLEVRNHRSSPAKHLRSALAQILGLLGFTIHDYVRTQGIHHFNYYIAPFVEKIKQKEIQNECDGFIKQLYREFISRPRDFICPSLTLDLDDTIVKNKEVIKGGTRLDFNYDQYNNLASKITLETLREYQKGYDDVNPYLYPRIFLALSKKNIKKLVENKELIDILYKTIVKSGSKSIYFVNREKDVGYVSDMTSIQLDSSDELRGKGCILATSIINFDKNKDKFDINQIIDNTDEILDKIRDFGNWKKRKILNNIYPNNFNILGSIRYSPKQKSYFVIEKPIVCIKFFSLKRIFSHYSKKEDEGEIFEDVKKLMKYLYNKTEEINKISGIKLTIGQTAAGSTAVNRAYNRYGINYDRNSLFSSIHSKEIDEKIKYDSELNNYINGGIVTRILFDKEKYNKEEFRNQLELCYEKDIKLVNFRDEKYQKRRI